MIRIKQIKIPLEELANEREALKNNISKILNLKDDRLIEFKINKRSLDARKRNAFAYVYTVDVYTDNENEVMKQVNLNDEFELLDKEPEYNIPNLNLTSKKPETRPVIVGFGPAGMFCALLLARAGLNPLVIERGKTVDKRTIDVERFWKDKELDMNSNVQFGEGGAGTFSDGKLNTLVKDKMNRGKFVLKEFVAAGAPEEILYENKPHIGTDKLRDIVVNIREEIKRLGGEILFETTLIDLDINNDTLHGITVANNNKTQYIKTNNVFLALGHSARDTFVMLKDRVPIEPKAFAVGLRIEHLQSEINKVQYKGYNGKYKLGAADYKLAYHTKNGRGVYTFCVCPGGVVVAAASEQGMLVTNGMSYYKRDLVNTNSAILVNVTPSDFTSTDVLCGMHFQRELEKKAFVLGGSDWSAPVQKLSDFLRNKQTNNFGSIKPSYTGTVKGSNLNELFPKFISESIAEGITAFDKTLQGFGNPDAILTGVESRSSSPIRILRNENYMSSIQGIYPVGEGAGYAGGIMSAAMDGMKSAEAYISSL